ncbi:MAG: UvrD-helicase domain-containing protein [Xanthomonadaceae bacterium]|nr:UvrD-helicase domain-containing protein [Xanthomonadaceae bacterium]
MRSFSEEQRAVIDVWGQGQAVIAGAGCGKSTTLVQKCLELLERNPKARFCAVSFTEKSALDLEQKFSSKIPDFLFNRSHWVKTIHGLCGMIIREHPEAAGMQGDERVMTGPESDRLWEQALEWLWFEDLPEDVNQGLEKLLERESRDSVVSLLSRTIKLMGLGYEDSLVEAQDPSAKNLYLISKFVQSKYERLKVRSGVIDFSDLEQKALVALGNPLVRKMYHERFDLVLVDEFQDTNWVQGQIMSLFSRPGFMNLCVVGDPKQSIYRFRDADLSVFEDFCSKLPVRQQLSKNFRSRPGIIQFVNQFSSRVFENLEQTYDPLAPGREESGVTDVSVLQIQTPKDLAQYLIAQKNNGIALGDTAILMRKIRGNEQWLDALDELRVPYVMSSGGFFWDDPRVREIVAFLKAFSDPTHRLSAAVFLRAPWMGISLEEIHTYMTENELVFSKFLESSHVLASRLKGLIPSQTSPIDVMRLLLFSDCVEEEVGTAWLGLVHRIQEWVSTGLSFSAIVNQLEHKCKTLEREAEVPPPAGQGQVQILTIHGSKGLEFPNVILIDFGKRPKSPDTPLLFSDRKQGVFLARRDEDGERVKKDPEELAFKTLEKKKNLEESARLLYVAQTRAMESLTLVLSPREWKEGEIDKVFDYEDWRGWFEAIGVKGVHTIDPSQIKNSKTLKADAQLETYIKRTMTRKFQFKRSRHSVTEWLTLEKCPRQYEWKYIRPRRPDSRDLYSETKQDEGKRVHRALELGDPKYLGDYTHPTLIEWMKSSPLLKGIESYAEYPFEIKVFDSLWVGVVDRIQKTQDSKFQLIDFKLTSKRASEAEMNAKYSKQLQAYTWASEQLGLRSDQDKTEIILVQIHPKGIDEFYFDYNASETESWIKQKLELSDLIVNDPSAVIPLPEAKSCAQCAFRQQCDVSQAK